MQRDDFQYVPDELKSRKQWLVWRFEPGEKKPLKVPYYASGAKRFGVQGDDKDRARLVTFDAAFSSANSRGFDGVGFAFLPGDGLIGVDIDNCVDEDGVMTDLAGEVLALCPSYTERSPSGRGFHIILSGETVTFKSNKVGLEVFCGRQFFTFTGRTLESKVVSVSPLSDSALQRLQILVRGQPGAASYLPDSLPPPSHVDRARLESALGYVAADSYQQWIKVGMAIYSALGDGGFRLWDYWSSKSTKYCGEEQCAKHWKSFGAQGVRVTDATIYSLAISGGWKPPARRPEPPLPLPEISPRAPLESSAGDESAPAAGPPPEFDAATPPHPEASGENPAEWAEKKVQSVTKPTIELLLQHFGLIYGTTDVWDGLTKQRIKKPAFIMMVGKDLANQWLTHEGRRTIDPDSLPVLKRGRAVDGGAGGDRLGEIIEKITLLYGTVTVWDSEKRMVMTLDAMRAAYGTDLVKRWQEDTRRAMVDADKLVFDPTQKVGPPEYINMFHGFPLVPTPDMTKVQPILKLIRDLCSGEENVEPIMDWLLKWLAFPLQNPGAKMQTAVLMFGEKQGTGKSLLFEGIMRPIYGEYGGTAGQHQLDSSFTDWKSRKVYMVFEEVLSRDDRYSHIGTLKHMVTGRDMRINPKNLPERVEKNHLNSVFLSNEPQPIPLELEDRRWLVIEARNRLTEEFIDEIKALMRNGASEAFYSYLLQYPLGKFDEHTKPLMTEAKRKIIRFGRPGWDAFHESWKEGALKAPYISCMSSDLYEVYKRWCERNQERKLTLTKFSELLASREVKKKKWVLVGNSLKPESRMCFLLAGEEEIDLNASIADFRDKAGLSIDDV